MAGNILISKISLILCTKFEMLVAPSKHFSKLLKFCIMYFITLITKMTDEEVKNLKFDFSWITLGCVCGCVCVCVYSVLKIVNSNKIAHCAHILWWISMALGQNDIGAKAHMQPPKKGVKGHVGFIWGHWPQMFKICIISHCIHILWWIFMGLGLKDIVVLVHMWPQLKDHLEAIQGHWPQMVKINTIGYCIHILCWIFMGLGLKNIGVGAHMWFHLHCSSWTQWLITSFDGDIYFTHQVIQSLPSFNRFQFQAFIIPETTSAIRLGLGA